MLTFVATVSLIIATILSVLHKPDSHLQGDSKFTVGVKVFIVSFVVMYIGLVFFTPQLSGLAKGQVIETCEPDF